MAVTKIVGRRASLGLPLGLALVAAAVANLACAAAQTPYPAKQIRMVIASGPGGGYDVYARIFAAHLGDHLAGRPSVVPENMPGAAGLLVMNWAANAAPRDGSVLVEPFNVALAAPLFGEPSAKFDPRRFGSVGSLGDLQNICATWETSSIVDLDAAKTRPVAVAAEGAQSNTATIPAILNFMLGTKFKPVLGYATKDMRLALERGEVEGICGLGWSTLEASSPDWIEHHRLHILAQTGERAQKGLETTPLLIDLVKDERQKQILRALEFPEEIGRPILTPPGTPADLVAALRRAFDETMKDPAFLADAQKAKLDLDVVSGSDMSALIAAAYATPADLVAQAAPFSGVSVTRP